MENHGENGPLLAMQFDLLKKMTNSHNPISWKKLWKDYQERSIQKHQLSRRCISKDIVITMTKDVERNLNQILQNTALKRRGNRIVFKGHKRAISKADQKRVNNLANQKRAKCGSKRANCWPPQKRAKSGLQEIKDEQKEQEVQIEDENDMREDDKDSGSEWSVPIQNAKIYEESLKAWIKDEKEDKKWKKTE